MVEEVTQVPAGNSTAKGLNVPQVWTPFEHTDADHKDFRDPGNCIRPTYLPKVRSYLDKTEEDVLTDN